MKYKTCDTTGDRGHLFVSYSVLHVFIPKYFLISISPDFPLHLRSIIITTIITFVIVNVVITIIVVVVRGSSSYTQVVIFSLSLPSPSVTLRPPRLRRLSRDSTLIIAP